MCTIPQKRKKNVDTTHSFKNNISNYGLSFVMSNEIFAFGNSIKHQVENTCPVANESNLQAEFFNP